MYNIIVVGGGPAGAIAAKYLAQSGKKVLLLQKDFAFKKPCGGGIRMDAFDEFNIDTSLINTVVHEINVETKKQKIALDISDTPLAVVDRVVFDEQLRQDAQSAGAEILEAKALDVVVNRTGVDVLVNINGRKKTYQGEYLVAADGVYSMVRKKLQKEEVPQGLTHYCDIDDFTTAKCHFYFGSDLTDKSYAWRFPYYGGADIGTFSPKNSKSFIHNLFKFLSVSSNEKVKGYAIPKWNNPIFYEHRVFYVGDAAAQVLPFTYEGIYYAMKSAKILSDVIIEDVNYSEYEQRWNSMYLKKFKVLKNLQKFFLKNDFMIHMMMKTLEKPKIKKKVLLLWMDNYEVKINFQFYVRTIKRMFIK